MWDKYAPANSGIAIKTSSDRLIKRIDGSEHDNSTRIIKRVEYTEVEYTDKCCQNLQWMNY